MIKNLVLTFSVVLVSFQVFAFKRIVCDNESVGFTVNYSEEDYLSARYKGAQGEWISTTTDIGPTERGDRAQCEMDLIYWNPEKTKSYSACVGIYSGGGTGSMTHPITGTPEALTCVTYEMKD